MTNLAKLLASYQQKFDIAGNALAEQIGIHPSALTRLKQGKQPDADSFVKIIVWMMKQS